MKITTKFISRRKRKQQLYQANALSALAGAAAATAATYWLDPQCGPERRGRVLGGAGRAMRGTGDALRSAPRRLTERMRGAGREAQERAEGVAEQAQQTLHERMGDGAWAPLPRLLAGAAGVGLVNWSLAQRSLPTAAAGAVGLALLARSATNAPLSDLPRALRAKDRSGRGAGRRLEEPQGEESPHEFRTTLGEALASSQGEAEIPGGPAEGAGEGTLRNQER